MATLNKQKSLMHPLKKLMAVIWCLVVMLFSGSPYQTIFDINILIFGFGIVALLFSLPTLSRIRGPQGALLILIVMVISTMVLHLEFGKQFYWRLLFILIISYYLSQFFTFKQITDVFIKIMVFVTLISFVGYALANYTNVLSVLPRFANINDKEYAIGIVFNYLTDYPERNCGIFWEPGIFATYLILAIAFEIFALKNNHAGKKKSVIHIIIFAIGLITANSTAGFALGAVCILLFFVSSKANKRVNTPLSLLYTFILVLFLIAIVNLDYIIMNTPLADNEYIVKLLSSNLEESARVTVLWINLELFFKHFFSGAGISEISRLNALHADISTATYILSLFGVLGVAYIGCIIKGIFRQKDLNVYSKLIFFVLIMAITSKEPHLEMIFTWILIFSLLKDKHAFS